MYATFMHSMCVCVGINKNVCASMYYSRYVSIYPFICECMYAHVHVIYVGRHQLYLLHERVYTILIGHQPTTTPIRLNRGTSYSRFQENYLLADLDLVDYGYEETKY